MAGSIWDLFLLPFRIAGILSIAILVAIVFAIVALARNRAQNARDWERGCTCDRGPWGLTLKHDCPIHGSGRRPRR